MSTLFLSFFWPNFGFDRRLFLYDNGRMAKDAIIYCRVSKDLKQKVARAAAEKGIGGESESVIVREALHEYFARRDPKNTAVVVPTVATTYPEPRIDPLELNESEQS